MTESDTVSFYLAEYDVDNTANHHHSIEDVPGVPDITSGFESDEFEDHLHSENPREDHVEDVHGVVKQMGLTVVLYGQTQCVEDDQNKHDVLEACGVDHIPELVLIWVFGNVATQRASFESVFYTLALVLVQLTVLILFLSLLLEGDDNETNKDVHHKEGDDDDVDDEEDRDLNAVVIDGTQVFSVGVDGLVKQSGPSFEGGDREESHHGHEDVVEVEVTVVPDPFPHHGQRCVTVVVQNVGAFAFLWAGLRFICASIKFPLEELYSDTSKHKLQQRCDDHDVADGSDGHKDTLDHMLESFSSVDGSKRTENP